MTTKVAAVTKRPVYKHIIVRKQVRAAESLVTPAKFQLIQEQLAEIGRGERKEVDADLRSFIPKGHTHKTYQATFGSSYDFDSAEEDRREQGQGAIIVATLNRRVPGGDEPLPLSAVTWTEPAAWEDTSPEKAFLEAANRLQWRFRRYSDMKFALVDLALAATQTLVTVAYQPICAYPLSAGKRDKGFDVVMEFHQVTRYGGFDMGDHDIYSDEGFFPVSVPTSDQMMLLMKTPEEIGEFPGFLTDEQRAENKAMQSKPRAEKVVVKKQPDVVVVDSIPSIFD